jgi:4-amino-4-deoxy-L-arabinose transferase-like glycosyltransferase
METTILVIGGLVLIGLFIVVAKFFFRLLRHLIIALILGLALMFFWYFAVTPRKNPNIGKHAYLNRTGEYLGEVTGEASDQTRGPVWIIKPPAQPATSYRKSSVTLKEK